MSADVTRIELAKALRAIKAVSTDAQFEQVKSIYIQAGGEDSVMSAVNGLSEEDEFALLTKLMGTATHIVGFEQRPLVEGEYIVPDFFVNFKPGCSIHNKAASAFRDFKCLIDVKSTEKDLFKVGGNRLQRLRNFATLLGLPLFFAVRFLKFRKSALWAIVKDDPNSTYIHATIGNAVEGLRHIFWDEYVLTPSPNLTIICKFSKYAPNDSVRHPDFGSQIETTFSNGINTITKSGNEAFMTCALLEAYDLEEVKIEKINDDITLQYLKPRLFTSFLADLIFKMNNLATDEYGRVVYDASKLIVRSDTNAHNSLVNKKVIEAIAIPLLKNNLIFLGAIKDPVEHLRLWKHYGGVE